MNRDDPSAVYYPASDLRITGGSGVLIRDSDGREFIDCASATFNLSLGYGHPAVINAMKEQADRLVHATSSFQTDVINRLSARLVSLAPKRLTKAHLKVSGGSTANEGAIKMAQHATGKRDVITFFRSHLGQTMAMAALSGNASARSPCRWSASAAYRSPTPTACAASTGSSVTPAA